MMDRAKLIAEIRKRPPLWDFQNIESKSRLCVPELWKEVATSMGPDVTIEDCKRRWKNVRDAYRAELKRIELRIERDLLKGTYSPGNDYGSKWVYFKQMRFIKDIRRPRRNKQLKDMDKTLQNLYYDENDLDQFQDFHSMDNIKTEPDETGADEFSLMDDENNDDDAGQLYSEQLLETAEKITHDQIDNSTKSNEIKINVFEEQSQTDEKPSPSSTSCTCSKRSVDQIHFLEDLEKEEQNLMKSTSLDITRSNNLAHIGDSDYNFLVSFLPQMKKMNELQNLQFRAKMTELMLNIMSQSMSNNISSSVSSSQAESPNN